MAVADASVFATGACDAVHGTEPTYTPPTNSTPIRPCARRQPASPKQLVRNGITLGRCMRDRASGSRP